MNKFSGAESKYFSQQGTTALKITDNSSSSCITWPITRQDLIKASNTNQLLVRSGKTWVRHHSSRFIILEPQNPDDVGSSVCCLSWAFPHAFNQTIKLTNIRISMSGNGSLSTAVSLAKHGSQFSPTPDRFHWRELPPGDFRQDVNFAASKPDTRCGYEPTTNDLGEQSLTTYRSLLGEDDLHPVLSHHDLQSGLGPRQHPRFTCTYSRVPVQSPAVWHAFLTHSVQAE
ncbi:Uncharacterized protein HZ326_22245 [Fusarium oxysporum f. sp. albedinis]|nr:Uncharacterized protein HZ326_22245 [Fusarium oxysporum f. sp. albedinis]